MLVSPSPIPPTPAPPGSAGHVPLRGRHRKRGVRPLWPLPALRPGWGGCRKVAWSTCAHVHVTPGTS